MFRKTSNKNNKSLVEMLAKAAIERRVKLAKNKANKERALKRYNELKDNPEFKAKRKLYRENRKEKRKEYNKQYYQANKERINSRRAERKEEIQAYMKEYNKQYKEIHKERLRIRSRVYYQNKIFPKRLAKLEDELFWIKTRIRLTGKPLSKKQIKSLYQKKYYKLNREKLLKYQRVYRKNK